MTKARSKTSAGYSGTPLVQKLGIKEGSRVFVASAPVEYRTLVAPIPRGVKFQARVNGSTDLAHIFVTREGDLRKHLTKLRATLCSEAVVWVSWPKKTSGVSTTVTEDTIRDIALPMGFVDVKVCAVNEVWSGLKLVVRKALRQGSGSNASEPLKSRSPRAATGTAPS